MRLKLKLYLFQIYQPIKPLDSQNVIGNILVMFIFGCKHVFFVYKKNLIFWKKNILVCHYLLTGAPLLTCYSYFIKKIHLIYFFIFLISKYNADFHETQKHYSTTTKFRTVLTTSNVAWLQCINVDLYWQYMCIKINMQGVFIFSFINPTLYKIVRGLEK